jgi:prepilin-type N-terminal cleavage/methylation domain-containing protein
VRQIGGRGFTLAEMIVVIAILGITAAAVLPAFTRAIEEDPMTSASIALERVLEEARETALFRAIAVRAVFVPETGCYVLLSERDDSVVSVDSGQLALSPGLRLWSAAVRPTIRFNTVGMADGDSLLVLGAKGARALVINRWTGTVHVDAR